MKFDIAIIGCNTIRSDFNIADRMKVDLDNFKNISKENLPGIWILKENDLTQFHRIKESWKYNTVFFLHASNTILENGGKKLPTASHFELDDDVYKLVIGIEQMKQVSIRNKQYERALRVIFFKHEKGCMVYPEMNRMVEDYQQYLSTGSNKHLWTRRLQKLCNLTDTKFRKKNIIKVLDDYPKDYINDNEIFQNLI